MPKYVVGVNFNSYLELEIDAEYAKQASLIAEELMIKDITDGGGSLEVEYVDEVED